MSWKSKALKEGHYTGYLNSKWHQFQGYEICLEELANCIQETLDYAEQQEKINEELRDENWKDEQLQAMKTKYDKMEAAYRRGFPISEEQAEKISEWKEKHVENHHGGVLHGGAIGGSWEYHFIPTSIGVCGTVYCSSCREKMKRELGRPEDYKGGYAEYGVVQSELSKKYDCEFEFEEID